MIALVAVVAVCVGALVYIASALITFAERRSVLASIAIAVAMSVGFIGLVLFVFTVIAKPR